MELVTKTQNKAAKKKSRNVQNILSQGAIEEPNVMYDSSKKEEKQDQVKKERSAYDENGLRSKPQIQSHNLDKPSATY